MWDQWKFVFVLNTILPVWILSAYALISIINREPPRRRKTSHIIKASVVRPYGIWSMSSYLSKAFTYVYFRQLVSKVVIHGFNINVILRKNPD